MEERRSTAAAAAAAEEEEEKVPPRDAVDVLLQDNDVVQGLPLDFISSHIIELMIPGEETVPMAMTLAVKFLSDCPVALAQMMVRQFSFFFFFFLLCLLDPMARIQP